MKRAPAGQKNVVKSTATIDAGNWYCIFEEPSNDVHFEAESLDIKITLLSAKDRQVWCHEIQNKLKAILNHEDGT